MKTVTTAIAGIGVAVLLAGCGASGSFSDAEAPMPTSTTVAATTSVTARPTASFDELVPITDGRLHIHCSGSGDETVVLIAGWDHGSEDWAAVEPTIAERTRVCTYDRFGTGSSDAPSTPQTFDDQVADLHELLDAVGEHAPYIVVGHSFGGAQAVTFAATYPDEVAGLLLVDASPPTWPDTVCSVPAYAIGCELMRNPSQGERLDVFPAFQAVAEITSLGDLPMTVISAAHRSPAGLTPDELERLDALWQEGTEQWAQLSTRSNIVSVEDTGHAIQIDRPVIVVDMVLELRGQAPHHLALQV